MIVCTVAARNYLAQTRVFVASLLHHHPGAEVHVLLLDGDPEWDAPDLAGGRALFPADLPLEPAEFRRMAAIYDVLEMSTAIKPWVIRHLLQTTGGPVLYFDPDIQVFGPLDDLAQAAAEAGIVVTPHYSGTRPWDRMSPSEAAVLTSGCFNLGFIGVSTGSGEFLDWWMERLRWDCITSPKDGLFVDQRWIDLLPGIFPHRVVRDTDLNVAYWNLDQRHLTADEDGAYQVDGRPLRFFHFSGYDPDEPYWLSKHQGKKPRTLLSQVPALRRICLEYAEALAAHGYDAASRLPYAYASAANGVPLIRGLRRLMRKTLMRIDAEPTAAPPDPFDPDLAVAFGDWLSQPEDPAHPEITRGLRALWDHRPDIHAYHQDLEFGGAETFWGWAVKRSWEEEGFPPEYLGPAPKTVRVPAAPVSAPRRAGLEHGVNLFGYVNAESGMGENARLMAETLTAAGIPHAVVPVELTRSRLDHPYPASGEPVYDVNLLCVNADQMPKVAHRHLDLLRGRYNIGYSGWETEAFPEFLARRCLVLDEAWLLSQHAAAGVAAVLDRPILACPIAIPPLEPPAVDRAALGLPAEAFVFLFCFDFLSIYGRKNPAAVIDAFRAAFAPGEGPLLVVKSINGHLYTRDLEAMRALAWDRPDILVRDAHLDAAGQRALMAACDCYVSLHRAEGFGLTMSEAMSLGKPVIATGYSGNLEFMTEANSYLVPYRPAPIPPYTGPYPSGTPWAEPDLDAAARIMREVHDDPAAARARGALARADLRQNHTPAVRARLVKQRLEEIWAQREVIEVASDEDAPAATGRRRAKDPDLDSLDEARKMIVRGPDSTAPTRRGGAYAVAVRTLRKALIRAGAPYRSHQAGIDDLITDEIEALIKETHRARENLDLLDGTTAGQGAALDHLRRRTRALENRTRVLEEALAQLREASGAGVGPP
ncbi:MAG TPA: glycosyltransferase [Candidatus Dormibacteraeota bacterium]|jgi:glycosyltransferase involved in cell wall biosynthesis|nr:glycosyltransferase [Candidatus Dormibacteraeota bacterium]